MSQDLPPDVQKRLRLMRYWLLVIFCAVSAIGLSASGVIMGMATGNIFTGALHAWPIVLSAAVLCLAVGFGYQYWLTRKK